MRHQAQVFDDVLALYMALQSSHSICVRRAQLNLRGEVPAEPIDFICDVDIKAKRAGYFIPTLMLLSEVPQAVKIIVGKAFLLGDLHLDGPYKTLYFRVKNQAARNSMASNEVALTGATIMEGN
jgi:hypothetical protein